MGQKELAKIVWLTRDEESFRLSKVIEIWDEKPEPTFDDGTVIWFTLNGPSNRLYIEDAKVEYRTVPDDARQCIRIG